MLYRLVRSLARLGLHIFYRRLEVEGLNYVSRRGPILFVANHHNALVDPLLPLVFLRRPLTLTAKNVLRRNPLRRLLMAALGVVPFHRREDLAKGAKPRQNPESLRRCRQVLARGGAVLLFAEGTSHSDRRLRPFRPGVARLALDFVRQDGNLGGLRIVPVGMLYTEKDQFRSDVWLRFGPPLDVAAWLAEHPGAGARSLTAEMQRRVEALTLNCATRREFLFLKRAAPLTCAADRSVAEQFRRLAGLQAGYRALQTCRPREAERLAERLRRHRLSLKSQGLEARTLGQAPLAGPWWQRLGEAMLLTGLAPLACCGVVHHALPAAILRRIACALSRDKDHWASNVLYGGVLVFPLCHALQVAAAWLLFPVLWAALYSLSLPVTGVAALFCLDRVRAFSHRARAARHHRRHPDRHDELTREGRSLGGRLWLLAEQRPLEPFQAAAAPRTGLPAAAT